MGSNLYEEFMEWFTESRGCTMEKFLIHRGIDGILDEFEGWLRMEGHIEP